MLKNRFANNFLFNKFKQINLLLMKIFIILKQKNYLKIFLLKSVTFKKVFDINNSKNVLLHFFVYYFVKIFYIALERFF